MKKTFTINLGGKVLNIDDDALESLQQYINALKAHYSKGEDGEEIMYDIESRLAELFIENLKQENRESVSIPDVEQAISIMGKPEGERFPNTAEADTISKLSNAIKKLETEVGLADIISVFSDLLKWVRTYDSTQAKEITPLLDAFVKSKLS